MANNITRKSTLITVVVPAYNAGASIERAIASIRNWKRDEIEIIVIDDGSEDDTRLKAEHCASQDSRIVVISQENRGRSSARNKGIAVAQGEWLMFVDADDYLLPGWEIAVERALDEYGDTVDFMVFSMRQSDGPDISESDATDKGCLHATETRASSFMNSMITGTTNEMLDVDAGYFEWNACWARLYRKELVVKAAGSHGGVSFPASLRFSEDRLFNLSILETMGEDAVVLSGAPIYYWNLNLSSTVRNVRTDDTLSLILFADAVREMGFEKFSSSLIAKEMVLQFQRAASLGFSLLPSGARAWKRVLEHPLVLASASMMPNYFGRFPYLYSVPLFFLRKRMVLLALVTQRIIRSFVAACKLVLVKR